jgi:hypothetical protein
MTYYVLGAVLLRILALLLAVVLVAGVVSAWRRRQG